MHPDRRAVAAALFAVTCLAADPAPAAPAAEIDARVRIALETLTNRVPGGRELHDQAKGVLVLPDIIKSGLIVGGAYGEGALLIAGQTAGYYSIAVASIGLQAGVQRSTQVLLFMTDAALASFQRSDGWQAGVNAEVTVFDKGIAAGLGTATSPPPVIGIVLGQDGFMAGASFEGGKISPIRR